MNSLLEKVKELDHQDQQKLVTALVTTLPPEGQQALLLPTVTAASSYVKWRLVSFISGQDTPDLLTLLPPELQIAVLQFVDGPSLLNATQVSREWNGIIKNHNHIWVKKCKELGVNIEKVHCGANWHQAYVSSLRQQLSLKNGTAFSERFMQLQNCKKAVKAVDYQNGFLCTVSEEDYVNIWQLELNIPVLAFPVERAVSCIKFRPNSLLICGHFVGILTAWDLSKMSEVSCVIDNSLGNSPGQYFLLWSKFKMHAGPVFSSDFSEELDLLVSGGADECIKLWCLSTGLVIKYALLLTIGSVLYSSTLVVVDVVTGETAGTHAVPHSKMTTPDGAQLVVGDIDWLNGLGGHLLDLSEPPLTTEFNNDQSNEVKSTKSCCSDAERQQNLNKVSSVVSSEDSHKIFQQNRSPECGTQQFSPCQPAELCECRDAEEEVSPIGAVGGELPVCMMGNSDTNLHYSNNNSPATISSEDVPLQAASLQYHGSNMNCTKDTQLSVRLERPGHLVLAAGVQSEPGRLFTLWWSNSKQTLKCKKE
ncbi:F-box/WD repeat-containing protein 2-like [Homarus americanus]|uniref:F-box/WD repeat-containing protein 2-like n=1 Tax=Homarus americanus TaxID=6706 RepID=A0A8J5KPG2_HOMAM|nr:F-box/WD repeat-containing protein 2-like [Homarus americanus]